MARRPFARYRHTGQWNTDQLSGLLSLVTGVALMVWLTTAAVIELAGHGSVWWHARVAQDLVSVQARVVGHDVVVFTSDGSWAHKNNPSSNRRTVYQVTPVVEFDYQDEHALATRARSAFPETFGDRADAMRLMTTRYAVGSEVVMLKVPGRDGRLLFGVDQAPSAWGMLVRIATELILLVFIYLPLVVMFALVVPAASIWLLTRPARYWPR